MEWGMPERPSTLRPRTLVDLFALGPLEAATNHLRRGRRLDPADDYDMCRLARQCGAFIDAYRAAKGLDDVMEDIE